jgi:serine/threonine protein kinase
VHPERWQRLKEIFEAAVEMDAAQRAPFLQSECRGDATLRDEVEALLYHHEGDSFLEEPASHVFSDLLENGSGGIAAGWKLGPYTVTRKIGYGGMGVVYLAHDNRLDRPVAIKALSGQYLKDPQQRERLRREARAAARLSHPGIATVYALEEAGNDIFIVSEYVSGRTLRKIMEDGPIAPEKVLDIAAQIGRALAAAHQRGIVHRDLKPENIMLTESGDVKILDFGLAHFEAGNTGHTDTRLTRTGMFLGTPAYSSPEQLLGSLVDRRADIFSYGILLFEMVSGRHPFGSGASISTIARILEGQVADLHASDEVLSRKLGGIVAHCLQKNRDDRYRNMEDLLSDLECAGVGSGGKLPSRAESSAGSMSDISRTQALWWWQFHQACAGFGYYGMLYPQWRVKEWLGGVEGSVLFFPLLIAVGIAANLRLHLWFVSKYYASELEEQHRREARWIHAADWLFVCMLAATAVRIHVEHAIIATLLMAVAIGALVAFTLIEPATARSLLVQSGRDHPDKSI